MDEGVLFLEFSGVCIVFGRCLVLVHNKRFVATELLGPQTSSFEETALMSSVAWYIKKYISVKQFQPTAFSG